MCMPSFEKSDHEWGGPNAPHGQKTRPTHNASRATPLDPRIDDTYHTGCCGANQSEVHAGRQLRMGEGPERMAWHYRREEKPTAIPMLRAHAQGPQKATDGRRQHGDRQLRLNNCCNTEHGGGRGPPHPDAHSRKTGSVDVDNLASLELASALMITAAAITLGACTLTLTRRCYARNDTWRAEPNFKTHQQNAHTQHLDFCRGGQTTWAQMAARRPPGEPYFEYQVAQFCMIHAFNAAMGSSYLRAKAVLQHAVRLCDNLITKPGGAPRLSRMFFSRNTGNFSVPILNHYLAVYNAGVFLKPHQNNAEYQPANARLCKIKTSVLTETYNLGIMAGSSQEQALSRLPQDCNSVMLHYEKIAGSNNHKYGHATCLRKEQETWWHIDSEENGPTPLNTEEDWAQIYGTIYLITQGKPATTAGDIEQAWEGLDQDPCHTIGSLDGPPTDLNGWQTVPGQNQPRPRQGNNNLHTGQRQAAKPRRPAKALPAANTARPNTTAANPIIRLPAHQQTTNNKSSQPTLARFLAYAQAQKEKRASTQAATATAHGAGVPERDTGDLVTGAPEAADQTGANPTADARAPKRPAAPPGQTDNGIEGYPAQETTQPTGSGTNSEVAPDNHAERSNTSPEMDNKTLKIVHHTLNSGLYRSIEDLNLLLHKHNPDLLTIAETRASPRQLKSKWLHNTLSGYKIFHPSAPKGGEVQAVIAIKEHIANLGEAERAPEYRAEEGEGRLVSVRLHLPRTTPLTVSTLYAPAGDSPEEQQQREALYTLLSKMMQHTHIITGDMNAALLPGDRPGADRAQLDANRKDKAHAAFVTLHQLSSPDGHETPRPHSFYSYGDPTSSSRIDDVLVNRAIAPGAASLQVVEEGTCSDHRPLVVTINLGDYGIFVPRPQAPGPPPKARKVLLTPMSSASRAALRSTLTSYGEGKAAEIDRLHNTLEDINNTDLKTYFHTIESQNGKTPNRLAHIKGRPAAIVVGELADALMKTCTQAQDDALQVCETKLTNPGGAHFKRRAPAAARSKLSNQLKAIRMVSNMARAQALETKEQVTHLVEEMAPSLPADIGEDWSTTCREHHEQEQLDEREQPGERSQHNEALALLRSAARTKRANISKMDAQDANEAVAQAAARQQHQLYTNPKKAHAAIFRKDVRAGRHLALLDSSTKSITDHPPSMMRIVTKHFADAQKHPGPGGQKTGHYLPGHAIRDYPFARVGATDRFSLETPASNLPKRPWLHSSIQDPTLFRDCISSLSNGKAPGPDSIQNEVLKSLPHKLQNCIHLLFIVMWATGVTPNEWKNSYTTLLWKGKLPETHIKGYRPIALLNTIYKLLTKLLTAALSNYAEQHSILSSSQKGFRQYSGTTQQLQTLVMALEDARLTGQDTYALLVDFTSAFNMINHDTLLTVMYDLGFPTDAIEVVRDLYTGATTQVRWGSSLTEPIPIERGSIQGDSLSPFLFLVYMEPLLRWLHVGGRGYKCGCLCDADARLTNHLSSAAYADDLAILTNKLSDLKIQAGKLTNYADWASLPVNTQKTYATAILHHAIHTKLYGSKTAAMAQVRQQLEGKIEVQGAPVAFLAPHEAFTYLGVELSMTLDWSHQHRKVLGRVRERLEHLRVSFATPAQKLRIIESAIKPAVTYAFCVTPYTKADIRTLDSAITNAVKRAYGLQPSAPTSMVHEDTKAFGLGCESLAAAYAHRNATALTESLRDKGRIGTITQAALQQQVRLLGNCKDPYKHAAHCMRARQLALVHASGLELRKDGAPLPDVTPDLIKTVLGMHDAGEQKHMDKALHKAMGPLITAGITHLGQLLLPQTACLIDGRKLRNELGKRCKAVHVAALNALARLLHADPCTLETPEDLLRARDTRLDISREERQIHPRNLLLTAGTAAAVLDVCPCPVQHVDPDQHLLTRYLKRPTDPPAEPHPQTEEYHTPAEASQQADTGPGGSVNHRCNTDRHRQHVPQVKACVDSIVVGACNITKPPPEPFARHDYNFQRVQRLRAAIEQNKRIKRVAKWQQVATAITNELYSGSYQIEKIGGWRMVRQAQYGRARNGPPKVQVQYLVHWAPSYIEDWTLQLFKDANISYKSATPAHRDALQDDACACEICWTHHSRAHAQSSDNHNDMIICDQCHKVFHCQCLGIPDTTPLELGNDPWMCPACTHHPNDPPPAQLLRIEWEPDWEPDTHLIQLGHAQVLKEWQEANHNQPPARPSDMALDAHLDNLTRQGFPAPWRNTWESSVGDNIRSKIRFLHTSVNPHTDIRRPGACRIEIRTVEVLNQGSGPQYAQQERACIYDPEGHCRATCSPARLACLKSMFERARVGGHHAALSPAPLIFEQEVLDLVLRYRPGPRPGDKGATAQTSHTWCSHATLIQAMRTHLGISADRFASPLDVHSPDLQFWSKHNRDMAFSAHTDAYSCKWQGYSYAFPGTDTTSIEKATKWALWSALQSPGPTATLLAIPRSRTAKGKPIYYNWINQYPKFCTTLITIPYAAAPLQPQDIWWCSGTPEGRKSKWDLALVLISNLPAQAELRNKTTQLTRFLEAAASLAGGPAAPIRVRRERAAVVAKLTNAGNTTWRQPEQPVGIITTASRKFQAADTEPPPLLAAASPETDASMLRQQHAPSPLLYDWRTIAYTDGSKMDVTDGGVKRSLVGAGLYIPANEEAGGKAEFTVDPAGAGPTNTINRAELAGIYAAASMQQRIIATDSATSMAQLHRAVNRPMTLRNQKHADALRHIVGAMADAPEPTVILKIKAHAGHIGNERADEVARRAATRSGDAQADITLPVHSRSSCTAGYWLYRTGVAEAQHRPTPGPIDNLQGDLREIMHARHRLGFSNTGGIYFQAWQAITKLADGQLSNGFLTSKQLTLGEVKVVLKYRRGLLYNNRLAFKWKKAPNMLCPLCGNEDGGTHMVSACQHKGMQGMYTERHNAVGRIIIRAILKGSKGGEICSMDLGSGEKVAAAGVGIPVPRFVPPEIIPLLQARDLHKLKPDVLMVSGNLATPLASRQVHIVELKCCQDTRPEASLQRATEQHSELRQQLIAAGYNSSNIQIVPILIGVSGTIYQQHTIEALQKLGVTRADARHCASKLHTQSIKRMHSIVTTRHALVHSNKQHDTGRSCRPLPNPP